MKRLLEYESERTFPEAFFDLFNEYEGYISHICREPDKLDCLMTSMRREMIVWFNDHQKEYDDA